MKRKEELQLYMKEYNQRPYVKERLRLRQNEYRQRLEVRMRRSDVCKTTKYKEHMKVLRLKPENKIKNLARNIISNAIRSGNLVRQPCEICSVEPAQAHHPNYNQPLLIQWLCFIHHKEIERKEKHSYA